MKAIELAQIAIRLGYYTRIYDDELVLVCPDVGRNSTDIKPCQLIETVKYNPIDNPAQLFEIMDMFQWFAIEHPIGNTWVIDFRVNLLDEELTTVTSDISRGDAILKAVLKISS